MSLCSVAVPYLELYLTSHGRSHYSQESKNMQVGEFRRALSGHFPTLFLPPPGACVWHSPTAAGDLRLLPLLLPAADRLVEPAFLAEIERGLADWLRRTAPAAPTIDRADFVSSFVADVVLFGSLFSWAGPAEGRSQVDVWLRRCGPALDRATRFHEGALQRLAGPAVARELRAAAAKREVAMFDRHLLKKYRGVEEDASPTRRNRVPRSESPPAPAAEVAPAPIAIVPEPGPLTREREVRAIAAIENPDRKKKGEKRRRS